MDKIDGYFDYASATPLDDGILQKMMPYFSTEFFNPSSLYSASNNAKSALAEARKSIASDVGARQNEIIFTSGSTEASNLAIHGTMQFNKSGKILISSIEHESVRQPARLYNYSEIPVDSDGIIDLDKLEEMITDDVVMVSIIYVNNETGVIQPLRKVASIVASIRKKRGNSGRPIYLHTDASQAPNVVTVNRESLGVDMMTLNGGKIYGPKGIGCLYVGPKVDLLPYLHGGGQEFGLRSGTENVPLIVGLAEALKTATDKYKHESVRLGDLKARLIIELEKLGCEIVSAKAPTANSILCVIVPGIDSETMVYKLDKFGLYISSGSACHAKSGVKSHVLESMGYSESDSMSAIRVSLGKYTNERSVVNLVKRINHILASK